jgi:hypothetical protein
MKKPLSFFFKLCQTNCHSFPFEVSSDDAENDTKEDSPWIVFSERIKRVGLDDYEIFTVNIKEKNVK